MEALKLLHGLSGSRAVRREAEAPSGENSFNQKPQTIAQRARESQFSRLIEILSQILSIEQDLMGTLSEDTRSFLLRHKVRCLKTHLEFFFLFRFSLVSVVSSPLRTVWT